MFGLDAVALARAQFGFTIAFHIIFPAFSIGLASYLAVLEALWLRTGRQVYLDLFQYWVKIFSLGFGMGVVSGVVTFVPDRHQLVGVFAARRTGDRAADGLRGVDGVLPRGRVPRRDAVRHEKGGARAAFLATCIVAIGTLLSAFWILSANSWMQTPRGYTVAPDGRFLPADWWAVIFNPSFFVRLPHMVLASYLSVAFVVGAVGAWHLLASRGRNEGARTMFGMAMWMAVLVAPVQVLMGDLHGLNTLHYQPAKVAALEGDWEPRRGAPEILVGWPDMKAETTRYAITVPWLGSLILTHSLDGEVPGLKQFPPADPAGFDADFLDVPRQWSGSGS